jgi:beta-glucuronidase
MGTTLVCGLLFGVFAITEVALEVAAAGSHTGPFPLTPDRTVHTVDGLWDFAFLGSNVDLDTIVPASIPANLTMAVPGAWDLATIAGTNLAGLHGTVLYRTQLYVTPNSFARLRFGACGIYCIIFIDGVRVCEHGGSGYTPFWCGGIAPSSSRVRTLEVIADNRFNYTRVPLPDYVMWDWYVYGGLYRSVEWHELGPAAPARADVIVALGTAATGRIDVRLRLHDLTGKAGVA